jgi:hypothetical protein
MTKGELKKEATEYALEWGDKTDGTYACCIDGYLAGAEPREKRIAELEKENAELKAEIRKMKSQHFTDIRLYTKVIGIAVEESVMNDKQNYKNYLFDKAKKILSMGVDK